MTINQYPAYQNILFEILVAIPPQPVLIRLPSLLSPSLKTGSRCSHTQCMANQPPLSGTYVFCVPQPESLHDFIRDFVAPRYSSYGHRSILVDSISNSRQNVGERIRLMPRIKVLYVICTKSL